MSVYLDHNATTPMRPEVREVLAECQANPLGNPSSLHTSGRGARHLVDDARERVSAALGVPEGNVIFTAGGTEAINLALAGSMASAREGSGLVTTTVEHSAVLATADALARRGHPVERIGVDDCGRLDLDSLAEALSSPDAVLVAVQAANNEIGVVPPLETVLELARTRAGGPALVFTDAVQALGKMPLKLGEGGPDLAAFSAHKVGGPPGVGVLVRRGGLALEPIHHGGAQESGLRPGTENVPGIVAAAHAIDLAIRELDDYRERVAELSGLLWRELAARLPTARLLGPPLGSPERLVNTLCVSIPGADGKVLVTRLDLEGLEVSAGSACASGSLEPSHVLLAMGLDEEAARCGIRLSLGRTTSREECLRAVDKLVNVFSSAHAS
jgi:cysteine desulfurase